MGSVLTVDLEIPRDVVRTAIAAARNRGLVTVVDPSSAARMDPFIYAGSDDITPNAREAEQLTGMRLGSLADAFRAADVLHARGARAALVKFGAAGIAVVNADARVLVRAPSVTATDTTGAGDAFRCACRRAHGRAVIARCRAFRRRGSGDLRHAVQLPALVSGAG